MPWKVEKIGEGEEAKEFFAKGEAGNPVWVDEDNSDGVEVDWPKYKGKVKTLIDEKKTWHAKHEETEKSYAKYRADMEEFKEKYKGIENPEEAFKALETVKNFSEKKLIEAGEVEKVKAKIREVYEEEKTTLNQKIAESKKILQESLKEKDNIIYKLTVSNKFAASPFIKEKTVYTPSKMEKIYGENFKVEDGEPVGYLNGEKIYSKKDAGEVAGFEEALAIIIDADPEKDEILKGTQQSGGGTHGSDGGAGGKTYKTLDDFSSSAEKAAYIEKHGRAAFNKIVDISTRK